MRMLATVSFLLLAIIVIEVFFPQLLGVSGFVRILLIVVPALALIAIGLISVGASMLRDEEYVLAALSSGSGWMRLSDIMKEVRSARHARAVNARRENRSLRSYAKKYSMDIGSAMLALEQLEGKGRIVSRKANLTPWELQARGEREAHEWKLADEDTAAQAG